MFAKGAQSAIVSASLQQADLRKFRNSGNVRVVSQPRVLFQRFNVTGFRLARSADAQGELGLLAGGLHLLHLVPAGSGYLPRHGRRRPSRVPPCKPFAGAHDVVIELVSAAQWVSFLGQLIESANVYLKRFTIAALVHIVAAEKSLGAKQRYAQIRRLGQRDGPHSAPMSGFHLAVPDFASGAFE